jgi:hypothetical protein
MNLLASSQRNLNEIDENDEENSFGLPQDNSNLLNSSLVHHFNSLNSSNNNKTSVPNQIQNKNIKILQDRTRDFSLFFRKRVRDSPVDLSACSEDAIPYVPIVLFSF